MKKILLSFVAVLSLASASAQSSVEMADAEIRKIDASTLRITLKHGFIKSIDMPPMTMVFTAKDKAQLEGLATGDKVQFAVEMNNGKYLLTELKKTAP